jgi:hypothetical protein
VHDGYRASGGDVRGVPGGQPGWTRQRPVTVTGAGARLLTTAYEQLDLVSGDLISPTGSLAERPETQWLEVGDWLLLAERMGAERVFFVDSDPVIVFASLDPGAGEAELVETYRRAWSMSRPRCLFVAVGDELRVYSLTEPPPRTAAEWQRLTPLEIVTRAADVADSLAQYERSRIESGRLFDEPPFSRRDALADSRLLRELRAVTEMLISEGLTPSVAHALLERVILVRYLEDRDVVDTQYFEAVADRSPAWREVLAAPVEIASPFTPRTFSRLLRDKGLTYAVFASLEADFNGDLFVVEPAERESVTARHLLLIEQVLTGAGLSEQTPLFLWAYDFSVVPTNLISSMYEQFYRDGSDDDSGTHYTPPELVEFVLTQVLTEERLEARPRICDPACGSGVFLVEAFRRVVRYESAKRGRRLRPNELRQILLTRIAGIDVNIEAIRLAAFSLYLAYLNYQTPRDILSAPRLPRLISQPGVQAKTHVLVAADAFCATQTEKQERVAAEPDADILPWPSHAFDVVIGNPPWTEPHERPALPDRWAAQAALAVGDRNRSQLFLWRALNLLTPHGCAALLVAAPALHNHRSRVFRRQWLQAVDLQEVVNFTPSRHLFFQGGIAPFMLLTFHPRAAETFRHRPVLYRTVRPSRALASTRSLAVAQIDRRWVEQDALLARDYLWKTYAWGGHHDAAFLARLDSEKRLRDYLGGAVAPGYGYQRGPRPPSTLLAELPSLAKFQPWGPLQPSWFEDSPTRVKRQPDELLYSGQRIIVGRGVKSGFGPNARLESGAFSFRHHIYCLPLQTVPRWQAETILAVLLSSLGRYRLFMTSGSWGVWHDSFVPEDILGLPMRMDSVRGSLTRRLSRAVRQLPLASEAGAPHLLSENSSAARAKPPSTPGALLADIDEAVFELFRLGPAERELVTDFHTFTLPVAGKASTPRTLSPLSGSGALQPYVHAFLASWAPELEPAGAFAWGAAEAASGMTAVVFETVLRHSAASRVLDLEAGWRDVLARLDRSLLRPLTSNVRRDGTVRAVSDTSIIIVKRNEPRLWSASAAREDAEATKLQAMSLRSP